MCPKGKERGEGWGGGGRLLLEACETMLLAGLLLEDEPTGGNLKHEFMVDKLQFGANWAIWPLETVGATWPFETQETTNLYGPR